MAPRCVATYCSASCTLLACTGGEVLPGPVERFAALLTSERARYDKLIREAQIKPD